MSSPRVVYALALADFRERTRRYSFIVTLLFGVYLGYAAARGQISLRLGEYRGLYTSAWLGAMMSLITSTFLSLVGFYVVKNAVARDRQTEVGEILASTPLSRTVYLMGKFLSNFAVLGSMVCVLALAALAMQFLIAEDRVFHPWALLSPFLLLSIPAMALVGALAVLFETVRWLRSGFGNVVWFFLWSFGIALPGVVGIPQLDPFGLWAVFRSIVPAAQATIPGYKESFSLTVADKAVRVAPGFRWEGIQWTTGEIVWRLAWVGVALVIVLLGAVFFDRFDPARSRAQSQPSGQARKTKRKAALNAEVASAPSLREAPTRTPIHLTPLPHEAHVGRFGVIYVAELRLALKGYRWWWYAIAAGLIVAQLSTPLGVSRGPLLTAAWIWPILMWSALGTRESRFGTQQLLFSSARVLQRQLPAAWLAGVTLAAMLGAGTAVRLAIAGQTGALLAWSAGALFIPSLALALGVWTGTSRFFEGLYTALWYVGPLNRVPGIDFTGGGSGALAGRYAWIYLGIAGVFVAAAAAGRERQLRGG